MVGNSAATSCDCSAIPPRCRRAAGGSPVAVGKPWQPENLMPEVRAALQKGIEDARTEMKKRSEGRVDGRKFFRTRAQIGTKYRDHRY